MSEPTFLVPVFDVQTLECMTVAVSAPNESEAVFEALHRSPSLRCTGGTIERIELTEENSVKRDGWHERYRPTRAVHAT
jgi:hypothetical protein